MCRDPPAGSQNELKTEESVYLPMQPSFSFFFFGGGGGEAVSNDCSLLLDSRGWQRYGNRLQKGRRGKVA